MRAARSLVVAMATLMLPRGAYAQTASAATFLGVDISGGYAGRSLPGDLVGRLHGWNAGVAVRVQPWLGFKGDVTHTSHAEASQTMYVGGVIVTSPYDGDFGVRSFAHAMIGAAGGSFRGVTAPYRPALVVGAGFDFLYVVRFQVDYVRSELLPGQPDNGLRAMVGGVLPMCFRRCGDKDRDGINLSETRKRN